MTLLDSLAGSGTGRSSRDLRKLSGRIASGADERWFGVRKQTVAEQQRDVVVSDSGARRKTTYSEKNVRARSASTNEI